MTRNRRLILIFILTVGCADSCSRPGVEYHRASANRPPVVSEPLDVALARFEAALQQHHPEALRALQPGLTDAAIDDMTARGRVRLTPDLRALYRWRNGTVRTSRSDPIPMYRFVPLDEAIAARDDFRRQGQAAPLLVRTVSAAFLTRSEDCLTIFDDQMGQGYYFEPGRRDGHLFFEDVENSEYREFPALANFLIGASRCYEEGIYHRGPDGSMIEDDTRALPLWEAYASY